MSDFLITSSISLAVLLGLYYLMLERQKMHRFNRFYLLAALVFSFVLPFITIEIYREVILPSNPVMIPMGYTQVVTTPSARPINYLPYIMWSAYAIGTVVMAIRFTRNLRQLRATIAGNKTVAHGDSVLVLLEKPVLPYTFLHYIFVNRQDYENAAIEGELYTHELVHVSQKHTCDVLFIEGLKTLFWFNPLLYFYKKAIQLNHEFLADEGVVSVTDNVCGYQELLLRKATPAIPYPLASSLNFSLTKKRFTMMTKSTSKKTALLLKLASLPVAAGLVVLLCTETVAQEKPTANEQVLQTGMNDNDDDKKRDRYYAGVHVKINDEWNDVYIDKVYEDLTLEEKRGYLPLVSVFEEKTPSDTEFENWKNKKKFALWLDGRSMDNKKLNSMKPKDIGTYRGSSVFKNARTQQHPQPYQFHLYTQRYFKENLKPMGEKYNGTRYELHIYKDKKIDGNTPIGAVHAMQNLIGEKSHAKGRDTVTFKDGTTVIADNIAQVDAENSNGQEDKIYDIQELEKQPEYPGGISALYTEVNKAFKIPEIKEDMTAKIMISFVVEKDGSMSNIKTLKDPGHGLGAEAERVLKNITAKWKPGIAKRKTVRTSYVIPITINVKN